MVATEPFTSANKYSKVSFLEGDYMLGAPEFVMKDEYDSISEEIETYQKRATESSFWQREILQNKKRKTLTKLPIKISIKLLRLWVILCFQTLSGKMQ